MTDSLRIELLADHPEAVDTVAKWERSEWGHLMPDISGKQLARAFEKRMNRDRVPFTLLGYRGSESIGTASLVVHDMSVRRDLSPWLAIVYVTPEQRHKGFGSRLVRGVMDQAASLGIERMFLFTPDQMSFYSRLGWKPLEVVDYRGEAVTIMEFRTSQANAREA